MLLMLIQSRRLSCLIVDGKGNTELLPRERIYLNLGMLFRHNLN